MKISYLIILISLTLLLQYGRSSCESNVSQLEGFECSNDYSFYNFFGTEYFKVSINSSEYVMRVRGPYNWSTQERVNHEKVNHIPGVLKYLVYKEDEKNVKDIDVFDNCLETLTLESTLLMKEDFLNPSDEKTLLAFFVKLLKTVMDIHDEDWVLSNLRMENIFISQDHRPLVMDMRRLKSKHKLYQISDELGQYTSLETFRDICEGKEHQFSGWEDYFAVGVLLYRTVYRTFPFNPKNIHSNSQYQNTRVKYESGTNKITGQLMQALIGKFSGVYQITDLRKFVENFEQIPDRYFNNPSHIVSNFAMSSVMTADICDQFLHSELEKNPTVKGDIHVNGRKIDSDLKEDHVMLSTINTPNIVQNELHQYQMVNANVLFKDKDQNTSHNIIQKLSSHIDSPSLLNSETKQACVFNTLLSLVLLPLIFK